MLPRTLLVSLVVLGIAASARANGPPLPEPTDFEVEAAGSGARIAESLPSGELCELLRYSGDTVPPTDMVTIAEYGWVLGEPTATWLECWPTDDLPEGIDCGQHPEQCVDCDDDGVNECDGYCETFGRFEVVEECVPVPEGEDSLLYTWCGCSDCASIVVIPVDPCQDQPAGGGADDGAGSCACRFDGGPGPVAVGTALGMIALGLACLAAPRRQR